MNEKYEETKSDVSDVVIMDVLDDESYKTNLDEATNRMTVTYEGLVRWKIRKTMRTSCPINVTDFPFDTQVCDIDLASWSYTSTILNISLDEPNSALKSRERFVKNNAWSVTNISAQVSIGAAAGKSQIPVVNCKIELKRKRLFYQMNLIKDPKI